MNEIATELESLAGEAPQRPGPKAGAKRLLGAMTESSAHPNFRKLRSAVVHHRVIILRRGAVVAVTSVVSVGVALLLHGLFAGLFVWSAMFPWGRTHGDGKTVVGDPDSGGAPIALPASLDDGHSAPAAMPSSASAAGVAAASALPAFPSLPDLPTRADAADLASPVASPIVPAPDPLGSVKVAAPASMAGLTAPPAVPMGTAKVAAGRGPSGADVAHGGFADEPVFSLSKDDGGGVGRGRGNGFGNGLDRGMSAADREPQLLNAKASEQFSIPMQYQLKPPDKPVELVITIEADGTISNVVVEKSCGVAELDNLIRDYALSSLRWSPAYHDGKAITADTEWGYSFRPFD